MINILNMDFRIDDEWCCDIYSKYINKNHKVLVLPLSYRDTEISNKDEWDLYYKNGIGKYYKGITDCFMSFGIKEESIIFINYFKDSSSQIISHLNQVDIIYLPGGLPTGLFDKIVSLDILQAIKGFNGVVIGCSAGAMIQLDQYHISPDKDYQMYSIEKGLGLLSGFGIEAHYDNTDIQNESINKYMNETGKDVYGIGDKGILISSNNHIKLYGDVKLIEYKKV